MFQKHALLIELQVRLLPWGLKEVLMRIYMILLSVFAICLCSCKQEEVVVKNRNVRSPWKESNHQKPQKQNKPFGPDEDDFIDDGRPLVPPGIPKPVR
jgi:hypothetical protein